MIQTAMTYVTVQGYLRSRGDNNFISKALKDTSVPELRTDDWLSYFADIVAGAVQYGNRTTLCDYLEPFKGKGAEAIASALVLYGAANGTVPDDYDRTIIASTTIDPNNAGRPWTFQYCTEFGWF